MIFFNDFFFCKFFIIKILFDEFFINIFFRKKFLILNIFRRIFLLFIKISAKIFFKHTHAKITIFFHFFPQSKNFYLVRKNIVLFSFIYYNNKYFQNTHLNTKYIHEQTIFLYYCCIHLYLFFF